MALEGSGSYHFFYMFTKVCYELLLLSKTLRQKNLGFPHLANVDP